MMDSATLLAIIERDREKYQKKLAELDQWSQGWEACLEHIAALIRTNRNSTPPELVNRLQK